MLLAHDLRRAELRLLSASPRDIMEFRDSTLAGKKIRRHHLTGFFSEGGKKQGLMVRSGAFQTLGFAIFEINAEYLAVSEFAVNAGSPNARLLLVDGLRRVARAGGVSTVLLYMDNDPQVAGLIAECGFKLMAYIEQDLHWPESMRMNIWRLAEQEDFSALTA